MPDDGVITALRLSYYMPAIDKASSGIMTLKTNRQSGPFEWAVGGQMGITTTSGATGPNAPTEEIKVNIPVTKGEEISVFITASEAWEDTVISFQWLGN